MIYKLEKELFPPLKKHFNSLGYKVFCEVPSFYRGVDFVAVKGDEQIAVEMKLHFNRDVVYQAHQNTVAFPKSYIAVPASARAIKNPAQAIHEDHERLGHCRRFGLGIYIVFPQGTILEFLEGAFHQQTKLYDFSQYIESDEDEAGLPFQKGVSSGYYELKLIKEYVRTHPHADWKEIFANVQNHYSNHRSLQSSMRQWRGFDLKAYKHSLFINDLAKKGKVIDETDDLPLFNPDKLAS